MKNALLILAILMAPALPAFAGDEFGTRFGGQTPAALSGNPTTEDRILALRAQQLQNITPAAGDEAPAAKTKAAKTAEAMTAEKFGPPVPAALLKNSAPAPQTP